jgi:hypothetical protein
VLFRRRPKIFCIGRNKTGTTSLKIALKGLGFRVGNQTQAELLIDDWAKRDFRRIVRYCRTADAFQDIPFSLDYTFQAVDQAFPRSKFILTVRDSSDQWFESLINFHSALFGNGRQPTANDLKRATYQGPGWMWKSHQLIYGCDETTLYHKQTYTRHYEKHNDGILDYFRHRPKDLLVFNLSEPDAMPRLCEFLDQRWNGAKMPHLNKSSLRTAGPA